MPKSKHAWIVAMLSASLVPGLVMPAIGQQPKAISETLKPVLAKRAVVHRCTGKRGK